MMSGPGSFWERKSVVAVAVGLAAILMLGLAYRGASRASRGNDFSCFLRAGGAILAGDSPYQVRARSKYDTRPATFIPFRQLVGGEGVTAARLEFDLDRKEKLLRVRVRPDDPSAGLKGKGLVQISFSGPDQVTLRLRAQEPAGYGYRRADEAELPCRGRMDYHIRATQLPEAFGTTTLTFELDGDVSSIRREDFAGCFAALTFQAGGQIATKPDLQREEMLLPPGRWFACPYWVAVLFAPLALFRPAVAGALWGGIQGVLLVLSAGFCVRIVGGESSRQRWLLLALPILLSTRLIDSDFGNGQVNTLILFFICLSLLLIRRRRNAWGGLVMAMAALVKLTPALFGLYFLYRRRWKVALFMTLFGIILLLVPVGFHGPASGLKLVEEYVGRVFLGVGGLELGGYVPGQSLKAASYRFLTPSNAAAHSDRRIQVNLLSLRPDQAEWVYRGLVIVVLCLLLWACRGPVGVEHRQAQMMEFALIILAMLLISPYSRKHHFVLLLLPNAAAVGYLLRRPRRRGFLAVCLLLAFALSNLTAPALIGRAWATMCLAACCITWTAVVLAAGLLRERRRLARAEPPTL